MGNSAINGTFPARVSERAAGSYIEAEQVLWTISAWQTTFAFPCCGFWIFLLTNLVAHCLQKFMKAGE